MSTLKCRQRKMINYRETRSCVEITIVIHCRDCWEQHLHCQKSTEMSLVVQWLRFLASTAGGAGFIPGQES